jgi:hypothetical protein
MTINLLGPEYATWADRANSEFLIKRRVRTEAVVLESELGIDGAAVEVGANVRLDELADADEVEAENPLAPSDDGTNSTAILAGSFKIPATNELLPIPDKVLILS